MNTFQYENLAGLQLAMEKIAATATAALPKKNEAGKVNQLPKKDSVAMLSPVDHANSQPMPTKQANTVDDLKEWLDAATHTVTDPIKFKRTQRDPFLMTKYMGLTGATGGGIMGGMAGLTHFPGVTGPLLGLLLGGLGGGAVGGAAGLPLDGVRKLIGVSR